MAEYDMSVMSDPYFEAEVLPVQNDPFVLRTVVDLQKRNPKTYVTPKGENFTFKPRTDKKVPLQLYDLHKTREEELYDKLRVRFPRGLPPPYSYVMNTKIAERLATIDPVRAEYARMDARHNMIQLANAYSASHMPGPHSRL